MVKIDQVGTNVTNDRGIVLYKGADDESSSAGQAYTSFRYRYVDPSGLKSAVATFTINIAAVNDAPIAHAANASVPVGGRLVIALNDTDVDADAAEAFATHSYTRVVGASTLLVFR